MIRYLENSDYKMSQLSKERLDKEQLLLNLCICIFRGTYPRFCAQPMLWIYWFEFLLSFSYFVIFQGSFLI